MCVPTNAAVAYRILPAHDQLARTPFDCGKPKHATAPASTCKCEQLDFVLGKPDQLGRGSDNARQRDAGTH